MRNPNRAPPDRVRWETGGTEMVWKDRVHAEEPNTFGREWMTSGEASPGRDRQRRDSRSQHDLIDRARMTGPLPVREAAVEFRSHGYFLFLMLFWPLLLLAATFRKRPS